MEQHLRDRNIASIVIAGLTTDHCVSSTARMAGDLGFDVYVVADATAAFEMRGYDGRRFSADDIHVSALINLQDEFATIISSRCTTALSVLPSIKRVRHFPPPR